MSLAVVGFNHRTAPLELRERLHFGPEEVPRALAALRQRLGPAGVVIVSTCNRVEFYVNRCGLAAPMAEVIRAFWAEWRGESPEVFGDHLYVHAGSYAVEHLFRVASSLDSLVVGEAQILGQVQAAYQTARDVKTTDKILNTLFEKAFAVAKTVRGNSVIGRGKVSVGSVAADVAVSIFGELAEKTVLVIGSGKMGELTLNRLAGKGVARVLLANRSRGKAEEMARRFGGAAISFGELEERLPEADIIISSTASPRPILGREAFRKALEARDGAPIFAIDIAMPRDIDPAVNGLDNVFLYHMDDLRQMSSENMGEREQEIARCTEMVQAGVEQFCKWEQGLAAEPTIVSMTREIDAIRERELNKTLRALSHLPEEDWEQIAYLSKRLVNAMLQQPMRQLKQEVAERDPATVLSFVNRLFGLNGHASL